MASNVVVLLNGGKRQPVKTTPTMPLKQIVKLVCEKQGYNNIENYGLKQNKTVLDLSLSVRFANLAPGAKLELVRVTAPKGHNEVTIALQVDDGGRIIEKFSTTATLWEILLHFESTQDKSLNLTKRTASAPQTKKGLMKKFGGKSNSNKLFYQQPVCLLLNQEYGTISLLKSTTLQSAGINSGNVLLRILFRQTELSLDDVLGEINTPIQPSTETNPINENNSGASVQPTTPQTSSTSEVKPIVETNMQLNPVEKPIEVQVGSVKEAETRVKPTEETNMQIDSVKPVEEAETRVKPTEETNMQVDSVKPVKEAEMQVKPTEETNMEVDSVKPVEEAETQVKPTEETNMEVDSVKPVKGAETQVKSTEETNMQVDSVKSVEEAETQVKPTEETNMQVDSVKPVKGAETQVKSTEETNMQVDSVKPIINSVETKESLEPVETVESKLEMLSTQSDEMDIDTRSPDVQDTTVKSLKDQEHADKINIVEPGTNASGSVKENFNSFDREVKVFNPPPENVTLLNQIDLPDSFYELTPSELQFLLAMQSSKRKAEGSAGFKTHAVREQERKEREQERERKYPKTLIRVRFPDSFQLQITFLSKETVGQLYEFVKSSLRTPQCSFCLYTSPPKKVLSDMSVSLYQAELAPASVVYFNWTDKFPESGHFLSDEYLKLGIDVPQQVADKSTSTIVSEQSSSFSNEGAHVLSEPSRHRNLEESAREQRSHARGGSSSSQISSKVPKWLKLGKKK